MEPEAGHYGIISDRYDELWSYSEYYLSNMTANLAEHLGLQARHRLADVGGGTGLYARRLRDHAGLEKPVIVSDPSREMLDSLPQDDQFEIRCETADEFALKGPIVDRILLKEVVHHFDNLHKTIGSLAKRLTPNGRMLVAMLPPTIDYPLFDAALHLYEELQPHYDTVQDAMVAAGLNCYIAVVAMQIRLSRERYLEMVRSRYMSVLSAFDDEQLAEGIREMRNRIHAPELIIPDRMILVVGSRVDK